MSNHILIVDDEAAIRDMVRMALEMEGFSVTDAANAHSAQRAIDERRPDLILLDWMMPGVSGIDFATKLKSNPDYARMGVIMLTARDEESNKIRGLDAGADDYVSKPFSLAELVSRVRAVLRRLEPEELSKTTLQAGRITINKDMHQALIDRDEIELSPTEFKLLDFFVSHSDRVFSRAQLLDQVWGQNVYVEDRTVDVHIRRLRKALEHFSCSEYIQTVRGVGYRFSVPREPVFA